MTALNQARAAWALTHVCAPHDANRFAHASPLRGLVAIALILAGKSLLRRLIFGFVTMSGVKALSVIVDLGGVHRVLLCRFFDINHTTLNALTQIKTRSGYGM